MSTTVEVMVAVALKVVDPAASMSFSRRVVMGETFAIYSLPRNQSAGKGKTVGVRVCV